MVDVKIEAPEPAVPEEVAAAEPEVRRKRRRGVSKDDQLSIPREVVRQIIRYMVSQLRKDTRLDRNAMLALHTAAEAYATDVFATAQDLVKLSDRSTVHTPFFQAAAKIHCRIRAGSAQAVA